MLVTLKLLSSPLWLAQALWMRRHKQQLPAAAGQRGGEAVAELIAVRLL